jgi:pyrroline-5-carboxylate reductase
MTTTIACIGSGNMGMALMKSAAGVVRSENIGFTDRDQTKAEYAARLMGATVYSSNASAISNSDFVFLAVKPQSLTDVLTEIAPALQIRLVDKNPTVLVSMAAGWSIEKIQAALNIPSHFGSFSRFTDRYGYQQPIIRIMPNTPVLIGQGMTAMAAPLDVPEERIVELLQILQATGTVDRVDEKLLDAITALSGSGPAFVYLFIEALADGGVLAGLPRDKALQYAVQTVLGSALMVRDSDSHPGKLKDMVTSPAGTTIAGVAALEKRAFRGTIIAAVEAAFKRTQELV